MSKKSSTKKQVTLDPSTHPTKKEPSTPLLRKVWYALTAIIVFVLVIVALILASSALIFLKQNPTCSTSNESPVLKNSAIAAIILSSICLILVIGFAALQVRNQRRDKRKEKEKATGTQDDDDDENEEEEEKKPKKKYKQKRSGMIYNEEEESEQSDQHQPIETTNLTAQDLIILDKGATPTQEVDLNPQEMQRLLKDLHVPMMTQTHA